MKENQNEMCEDSFNMALPQLDFKTFLLSLSSSALVHLGEVENPESGKKEPNAQLAKHSIDIIAVLEDKIKNGMTDEESKLLCNVLYNLRMKYTSLNK